MTNERFDEKFRHRETNWEGSPVESSYETWNAENLDDLSANEIKTFIQEEKNLLLDQAIEEADRLDRAMEDYTDAEYRANFHSEMRLYLSKLKELKKEPPTIK